MRCGSKGVSNGIFKEPLLVQKLLSCYLLQHTGCRLNSDSGTFRKVSKLFKITFPFMTTFTTSLGFWYQMGSILGSVPSLLNLYSKFTVLQRGAIL